MVDLYETVKRILPSLDLVDEYENPQAIAHFTNQQGWDWYIIAGKDLGNEDLYLFGLVNGYEKELGFFTLKQILGAGAVYDLDFIPIGVFDIYPDFDLRRLYFMEMTTIKISQSVKKQLNTYRFEKEAYNTVIQRLIKENEELRKDKERLFNIVENSQ